MKKKIFVILAILIVIAGALGGYFYFSSRKTETFTAEEQRWIDSNKNHVIDISIPRNIAGFTYMGKGVFFDFVTDLEKNTGLSFNKVPYDVFDDVSSKNYAVEVVDKAADNQIFVMRDNYIILSKKNDLYTAPSEMKGLKIGVLKDQKEEVEKHLVGSDVELVEYETEEEMNTAFNGEESTLDSIVGLRSLYLDELLKDNLHISYHITDMTKEYVITLNGDESLNSIIKKTYSNWQKEKLELSYNENLLDTFYEYKGVTEKEQTALRDKSYIYAFNENGAYDKEKGGSLQGINYQIVKSFAEFANIDMEYSKAYANKEALVDAFNDGSVDFCFRNDVNELTVDYYNTVSPITANVVIVSNVKVSMPITSIYSLANKKVMVVRGTKIEDYLSRNGITVDSYDTIDDVLKNSKKDSILAIDLENYEYYKTTSLAQFKIDYQFALEDNYGYTVNGSDKLFGQLFNFYLQYMPVQDIIHKGYQSIFVVEDSRIYYWIAIVVLALLTLIQLIFNMKRMISAFKKKHKKTFTKNEKIRYIDSLTSLKNRAYLNDAIEKWDSSEIYPQMIVIVDLNNIAYINDNFGHEEGDKVITEAANILIKTQMPRSEIIRTDGNEFLVYLVGYEEKEINSYTRKLSKEFKELSHGFGAAIGSSVIHDALKTIDDAINEATLDMKNNKESMTSEEK